MIKIALTFFAGFLFVWSHAQEAAIDSRGEPVFLFYSPDDARMQLSRRSPLSGSYLFNPKERGDNKISGLLLQAAMLNSGDFPLLARLKDVRPGVGIKLGYQHSIQQFSAIDKSGSNTSAWGINGFFSVDNIKLYDTLKQASGKRYPLSYGAEGHYTIFFKNGSGNAGRRKALSFYAALSGTWNDRNLLSYQEISRITLRPDVVAMQEFDGRYGTLKKNFLKYRMAASYQLFYGRFNLAPYIVAIFGTQNSPSYHLGVFTNILSSSLKDSDNRMPGSFGIGFDWVYATEHLSPKINLFARVSISLGKLKSEK